MDRKTFFSLLKKHFYPVLRAEGFVGTGQTLRRAQLPIIHIINIQGSTSGNQCYINLGAHLAFLPADGGGLVIPETMDEPACVFRGRIDPILGSASGWQYGQTPEEAKMNIDFLVDSEWATQGRVFFDRYAHYPDSFSQLLDKLDPTTTHAIALLNYTRIALHLERFQQAQMLAQQALATARTAAVSLHAELKKVIEKAQNSQ